MPKFWRRPEVNLDKFLYISQSVELVASDTVLKHHKWQGVSSEYLNNVEKRIDAVLPLAFKEYCRFFGNLEDQMFGREGEYDLLTNVLIAENEPLENVEREEIQNFFNKLDNLFPQYRGVPAFCFSSHEGYVHYWFYLTGTEDPDCFYSVDFDEINEAGPFSDFLFESLKSYSKILKTLAT